MLHCFPLLQAVHWRVVIVHVQCVQSARLGWGLTVSIFSQLRVLFYLWICPLSVDNLIVALQHQPLIYYNLETTQKEFLNLFPSAPKNGELTQVQ